MDASTKTLKSVPRDEILRQLGGFVESQLTMLLPVEKCWQPSDFLPDMGSEAWLDQVTEYRRLAALVPDSVLVTLVANMITEEALPSYHAWLANLEGGFDRSGVGVDGMARWMRGWVAEEKRHGDVLAGWLYMSGRVDMRAIERTIQHLLRNGFDPQASNNVINGFIYTAFQERATFVAHAGVARLAREHGDHNLAKICDQVAGDEARHGRAYERFVAHLFEISPDETMLAFDEMMRRTIVMPSQNMTDGRDADLFTLFSSITQRNGIYTTSDYARIVQHLVRLWDIETIPVVTDIAKAARHHLVELPARFARIAERAASRKAKYEPRPISWLTGRVVSA